MRSYKSKWDIRHHPCKMIKCPFTIPNCNALEEFTGAYFKLYRNLRYTSQMRANNDITSRSRCFESHPQFCVRDNHLLTSLSTGIIADFTVIWVEELVVGENAVLRMVGKSFYEVNISWKDEIKYISAMINTINLTLLFIEPKLRTPYCCLAKDRELFWVLLSFVVIRHFGDGTIVIFDGSDGPLSTRR